MLRGTALLLIVGQDDDVMAIVDDVSAHLAGSPYERVLYLTDERALSAVKRADPHSPAIAVPAREEDRNIFDWRLVHQALPKSILAFATLATHVDWHGPLSQPVIDLGDDTGKPLALADTPTLPQWLSAAYIRHTLSNPTPPEQTSRAGRMALRTARRSLEAVDMIDGNMHITVRLSLPGGIQTSPPWQFRVGLKSSHKTIWANPAELTSRTNWDGRNVWDRLVARVPIEDIPSGTYEVLIASIVNDEYSLRSSPGALGPGTQTKLIPGGERRVRYLTHARGAGRSTYLTVQHGDGMRGAWLWALRRLNQDLAFIVRGRAERRYRALALIRLLTLPIFSRSDFWLIGERPDAAHDNGFHLFRHIRHTSPKKRAYYILDKNSPQYERVRMLGHVIPHSSRRHEFLMLHAKVLANPFALDNLTPNAWSRRAYTNDILWRVGALRVFLQHGIHVSPNAVQRLTTGYDLFVTSTDRETEALRQSSGYTDEFRQTGLPRYDSLSPTPPSGFVFFMPTWRRYLPSRVRDGSNAVDVHEASHYDRFMRSLLTSSRLHSILETYGRNLIFMPHYNLADRFRNVTAAGERIRIFETRNDEIQALIMGCDAFITDHSSLHFDAAYIGTPVIYARFDKAEYEKRHASPSWFDFERDGFGPVAESLDSTLTELEHLFKRGCRPDPIYQARAHAFFSRRDKSNSARVVAAIEDQLAARRKCQAGR